MSLFIPIIYELCETDVLPSLHSVPRALNVDQDNPNKSLLSRIVSQYRNSRTGNARRAVSQPDHDILEGLPIRRWHKKPVNVATTTLDKVDPATDPPVSNGYPEREMPRDWTMLSETCQAILLAARRGMTEEKKDNEKKEGAEAGNSENAHREEKPGLLTRKWALFSKDFEPKEPEFLAKRRKGLRSLYGGSTVPISTSGQMRKIKIRNVDSEGNSQIVEALVPEGQAVDAEIVEEELTSPTQALTPGTKVEGVGVANSEGVLVPEEQAIHAAQRRKPPPPKRRLKGPGRGRKKKVAFVSGTDGNMVPVNAHAAGSSALKAAADGGVDGVQGVEGDHDGEDSTMQDIGQDGEEGSEDGSEGEDVEEGPREDGEVSETPEVEDISRAQPILETLPPAELPAVTDDPQPPTPLVNETQKLDDVMHDPPISTRNEEIILDQVKGSAHEHPVTTLTAITPDSFVPDETNPMKSTGLSRFEADATHVSHPMLVEEAKTQPYPEISVTSPQPVTSQKAENVQLPPVESSMPQPENAFEALEDQYSLPHDAQPPPVSASLLSNSAPSLPLESVSVISDSVVPLHIPIVEPEQEVETFHPVQAAQAEAIPLIPSSHHSQPPHIPSPSQSVVASMAEPVATPELKSAGVPPSQAPPNAAPTIHQEQPEAPKSLPIESGLRKHTPNAPTPEAPTPSPPTPIATSFGPHQLERLMESPRAPTMSPPTPARDLSSSPDLPLAGHREPPPPPPLAMASATKTNDEPDSAPPFPPPEDRIEVEAAPHTPENFTAEIPHSHDPLDGLAVPEIEIPDQHHRNDEEGPPPATFPNGDEDLLGSLERSTEK